MRAQPPPLPRTHDLGRKKPPLSLSLLSPYPCLNRRRSTVAVVRRARGKRPPSPPSSLLLPPRCTPCPQRPLHAALPRCVAPPRGGPLPARSPSLVAALLVWPPRRASLPLRVALPQRAALPSVRWPLARRTLAWQPHVHPLPRARSPCSARPYAQPRRCYGAASARSPSARCSTLIFTWVMHHFARNAHTVLCVTRLAVQRPFDSHRIMYDN